MCGQPRSIVYYKTQFYICMCMAILANGCSQLFGIYNNRCKNQSDLSSLYNFDSTNIFMHSTSINFVALLSTCVDQTSIYYNYPSYLYIFIFFDIVYDLSLCSSLLTLFQVVIVIQKIILVRSVVNATLSRRNKANCH